VSRWRFGNTTLYPECKRLPDDELSMNAALAKAASSQTDATQAVYHHAGRS
jgi:hypothetical protein